MSSSMRRLPVVVILCVHVLVACIWVLPVSATRNIPFTLRAPDNEGHVFMYQGGDEFSCTAQQGGFSAPNASIWDYDIGYIANDEKQYYTAQPTNVFISADAAGEQLCRGDDDGFLQIRALKAPNFLGSGFNYTSSRLKSDGLFCVELGSLLEVRARVPSGRGTWPAIWMLGPDSKPWPATGEIDVMEAVGFIPNRTFTTIHGADLTPSGDTQIGGNATADTLYSEFHVYASIWNESGIFFFTDNVSTFSIPRANIVTWTPWEAGRCFYVVLNLAVGGQWGGIDGIDNNMFPVPFAIDYVRVYSSNTTVGDDAFWVRSGLNAPNQQFALGACGANTSGTGWQLAELDRVRFPVFTPYATGKATLAAIDEGDAAKCASASNVFVGGVRKGYLYKMPGGTANFNMVVHGGRLAVGGGGMQVYAAAELQVYAGGAVSTAESCCVFVSWSGGETPGPGGAPVSSSGMSTATKWGIGVGCVGVIAAALVAFAVHRRSASGVDYDRLEMDDSNDRNRNKAVNLGHQV